MLVMIVLNLMFQPGFPRAPPLTFPSRNQLPKDELINEEGAEEINEEIIVRKEVPMEEWFSPRN